MRRSLLVGLLALGCGLILGAAALRHALARRHYRAEPRETRMRPVVAGPQAGAETGSASAIHAAAVPLARARDGVLVWEAEHANRLTGTFAVLPSEDCGGGLALWCREGQGKNNTTTYVRPSGGVVDQGIADYYLDIPRSGDYRLFIRLWAMDQCGNSAWVGMDTETELTYFPGGQHGRYGADHYQWPESMYRRWLWIDDEGTLYHLKRGPHRLRIEVREDGVAFDQIALVPKGIPDPSGIRQPTLLPGAGAWPAGVLRADTMSTRESNSPTPFDAFFAVRNRLLFPAESPAVAGWLTLRLNAGRPAKVTVHVAAGKAAIQPAPELHVRLTPQAPFACIPVRAEFLAGEPSGGLRFATTVTSDAAPRLKIERACRVMPPLDWWAAGPLRGEEDARVEQALAGARAIDPRRRPPGGGRGSTWTRVQAPQHYDAFGAVDFNRLFGRQEGCTAHVATRIRVTRSGDYLLYAGGDDTLRLRLDGQPIVDEAFGHPLTDTAGPHPVRLEAGEHLLYGRIAQQGRSWQMVVEFLDASGQATPHVVGLPLR